MRFNHIYTPIISCILIVIALMSPSAAHAHLMVAQHGTLNWVDNGVFMVLSLPISAFEGIDDNHDGQVSMVEFNNHRSTFTTSVKQHVKLSDKQNDHPLEGILLSPVIEHGVQEAALSQLIVMGRFALIEPCKPLYIHVGLYGKETSEQSFKITATRPSNDQKHVFNVTLKNPTATLFP